MRCLLTRLVFLSLLSPPFAALCPDTWGRFPPQVKTEISVESKHQTLQGLAFPLQLDAQQAIQALKQKKINYIQLVGPIRSSTTLHSHHFLLLPLTPVHSPVPLSIRSWIWSGKPLTWCTQAPQRSLTCPRGSPRTRLATISSCTNTRTRETTWSLSVSAMALGVAG